MGQQPMDHKTSGGCTCMRIARTCMHMRLVQPACLHAWGPLSLGTHAMHAEQELRCRAEPGRMRLETDRTREERELAGKPPAHATPSRASWGCAADLSPLSRRLLRFGRCSLKTADSDHHARRKRRVVSPRSRIGTGNWDQAGGKWPAHIQERRTTG